MRILQQILSIDSGGGLPVSLFVLYSKLFECPIYLVRLQVDGNECVTILSSSQMQYMS